MHALLTSAMLLSACGSADSISLQLGTNGIAASSTQHIEISSLTTTQENQVLARELAFYDRTYFVSQLTSMDKTVSAGVQLGYFVSEQTQQPSFRITYDLSNPAVRENHEALMAEFETFIPALATQHIESQAHFQVADVSARDWLADAFTEDAMAWHKTSPILRKHSDNESFDATMVQIVDNLGEPTAVELELSQAYTAYDIYPDSVLLFYRVKFSKGETRHLTMRMHQIEEAWLVMSFFTHEYVALPTL